MGRPGDRLTGADVLRAVIFLGVTVTGITSGSVLGEIGGTIGLLILVFSAIVISISSRDRRKADAEAARLRNPLEATSMRVASRDMTLRDRSTSRR